MESLLFDILPREINEIILSYVGIESPQFFRKVLNNLYQIQPFKEILDDRYFWISFFKSTYVEAAHISKNIDSYIGELIEINMDKVFQKAMKYNEALAIENLVFRLDLKLKII